MKLVTKIARALAIIALFHVPLNSSLLAQEFEIFFEEDFEYNGLRPPGWNEQAVAGTRIWRFQNGGYAPSGAPNFRHPPNAHGGAYNALFQDESIGPTRKLFTPIIPNIELSVKPTLYFWHAQDAWLGSNDELKVYYRVSSTSSWVFLELFSASTPNWVLREIILPDAAKTTTTQIAFEARSNYGWGVCIDDVSIEERGILPRTIQSFTAKQYPSTFASGSSINPYGFINIAVVGNTGNIPITSLVLNYTGSEISNISGVNFYHTRDSIFSVTNKIPGTISISSNEIRLEAPSFDLLTGNNYIWATFDISPESQHGNTVDFEIAANSASLGSFTFPTANLTPAGVGVINKALLFDDFEQPNSWTSSSLWEVGIPLGGGTFDPTYPYSGISVLATNLNGNYPSNIPYTNPEITTSPVVNAKYYKNLFVSYRRWLNIEYFDKASVKISNNNGDTWSTIFTNSSDILDRNWRNSRYNISSVATRKENVTFSFAIDTTNSFSQFGGWNIDNFAITGEFIHSDVGVKGLVKPIKKCGYSEDETVSVIVKNYGGATVNVPFEVGYSLDGGTTFTKESFTQSIASEAEIEFEFTTPVNLLSPGLKNFTFRTFLTNDQDAANNSFSNSLYVFPTVAYPFETSFESTAANFYASGTNSSWQWGVPSGSFISSASNGTRAWVTSLAQNYKNNELSYLESPCFDFSTAEYPVLSFDYKMQIEPDVDGLNMEYSIDGGTTWSPLTAHIGYSQNWYNTETVQALGGAGWSQNTVGYVKAKTLLPSNVIGINGVKFRFVFASNDNTTYEGVSIDVIKVYELPYDIGITEIVSPQDACEIGNNVPLELRLKNFGYRPVPNGTVIPIKVTVNNALPKIENISITNELAQNQTYDFETVNTFNLFAAQFHNIVANTDLLVDDNNLNNTLTTQVEVYGMPSYSIGPDIGTMQPDTVDINAGAGFVSYTWSKKIDPDDWIVDPAFQDNPTFEVEFGGFYAVTVENSRGCFASDTLEVLESDKDVGVISIVHPISACEYNDPVSPQVTIKNFGPGTYDGIESIPVTIMVDGLEIVTESFIPDDLFAIDEVRTFTFSGGIDLSEAKLYNISIYTNLGKDLNKNNDSTHVEVATYGLPQVSIFAQTQPTVFEEIEDIITTRADTIVLKATEGFDTYVWERKILGATLWTQVETDETLIINNIFNNLLSAFYRVTVTDVQGCGSDTHEIFVNTNDLAITAVSNPDASTCFTSEATTLAITVTNVGHATYPISSQINAKAITPLGEQEFIFLTPAPLQHNESVTITFPETINFPLGDYYLNFEATSASDPNPNNNSMGFAVTIHPLPEVNIEPDTLSKIFTSTEFYEIIPTYSADASTYLWHDNSSTATYWIWGIPIYDKYKVTTENEFGCAASDSLMVITSDLAISTIESPSNDCELANNTPISFRLFNNGNTTYQQNSVINVTVNLNGALYGNESITLASNLASKAYVDVTLSQVLNLEGISSATVQIEINSSATEVYTDNNILEKAVYALGYPSISLGEDREVHAWEEVLDPGFYEFYEWQDLSTNRTFTATESGTYSVTVTDFAGCQGYAEVELTFFVDDIGITTLNQPISACNLSNAEPVNATIKNFGTFTLPSGMAINTGFTHEATNHSEVINLPQSLSPNQEYTYTFSQTVNLSERKEHSIIVWANIDNDMTVSNNSVTVPVFAYPEVDFNFALPDTLIATSPVTLFAEAGFASYLWNTNETTSSIEANVTGLYWVEVGNEYGCTGRDSVYVAYPFDLAISQLVSPQSSCSLTTSEPVQIVITNTDDKTVDAGTQIGIELSLNSEVVATETLTLENSLTPTSSLNYTLTNTANLFNANAVLLKVEIVSTFDTEPSNNAAETTVTHFSHPSVNLGADQYSYEPITLDAGTGYASYLWQDGSDEQTFYVTETGLYSVTVSDANGCSGYDEVNVTLLIPDYSIAAIVAPTNSCQLSATEIVTVEIANVGADTIKIGEVVPLSLLLNGNVIATENMVATQQTIPLQSVQYTFTQTANLLLVSTYTLEARVNHALDQNSSNNKLQKVVVAYGNPTVDLGDDRVINEPTTLDAGAGYVSYLWQDGSTSQTLTVSQTALYSVTVTDENGCQGYDEVLITYVDPLRTISVAELISPVEVCYESNFAIEVKLKNTGEQAFASGEAFNVTYKIANETAVSETITLTENLEPLATLNYEFDQRANLPEGNTSLGFWTTIDNNDGPTANFEAIVFALPVFNLGPDTLGAVFPYLLNSGIVGASYLWSTNSTESSITVSETGNYWLAITSNQGCTATDTIYIFENAWARAYPNPASTSLKVDITPTQAQEFVIELLSAQGYVHYQLKTTQEVRFTFDIDVSTYASGLYLLRIKAGKEINSIKIIIQNNKLE